MIALADGFSTEYPFDQNWVFFEHAEWNAPPPPPKNAMTRRHLGKLSVVYCDGHVEAMKPYDLYFNLDPKYLRKWNRDNKPHMWWTNQRDE
jgi:prepilin-type processing-associated H-X9-DG protein